MSNFVEFPVNKISISQRKLVHGVGINDCDYIVRPKINGKKVMCPIYRKWAGMIERCYSAVHLKRQPTYIGCSVSSDWLLFSNFRAWMKAQDWEGKQLDKDILVIGNKIYSSETCIFVSGAINSLLTDQASSRGGLPRGVILHKQTGKFRAWCNVNSKMKHLGLFEDKLTASVAYLKFKSSVVEQAAYSSEAENNKKLQYALLRHAKLFMDNAIDIENGLSNYCTGIANV